MTSPQSRFLVLVHHKLSKLINHRIAQRAKQPAIVHMKCTFWIISCPVIRSYIYREIWSCFRFRRSTRHFNNKLIHGVFCLALNERNYFLQATIDISLFFPQILQFCLNNMRFLTNYAKSWDLKSIMRNRNITEYQKPCHKDVNMLFESVCGT